MKTKRGRGRPRAALGTVRILAVGVARLSPDLAKVGQRFLPEWDDKNKIFRLYSHVPFILGTWQVGYCVYVSLIGELRKIGDIRKMAGVYRAKRFGRLGQGWIEIYLKEKVE